MTKENRNPARNAPTQTNELLARLVELATETNRLLAQILGPADDESVEDDATAKADAKAKGKGSQAPADDGKAKS